jgi:hemolysin III
MHWLEFRQPVSSLTHASWFFLAIPVTLLLWRLAGGDRVKQVGLLIYGACLTFCYAGSALWHAFPETALLATLDYAGIFALIAGTTTPILLVVLRGGWRWTSLAAIWIVAACGMVLSGFHEDVPVRVFTILYLGMGWGMCFSYFQLTRILPHRKMFLVLLGGLLYSVGAVLNWAKWPVLLIGPPWIGPHEVFHVFVMAGSLTHFVFMVKVLLPFQHPADALPISGEAEKDEPILAARGEMVSLQ